MQINRRAYHKFSKLGISLASMAGMLFFAASALAQQPPAGLVCNPFPAPDAPTYGDCVYYYGLNNIGNVDDGNPATNMPSSRPANCSPLPTDQATLEACIYYQGIDNANIYANNPPVTPVVPPPLPPVVPGRNPSLVDTTVLTQLVSSLYVYALGLSGLLAVAVCVWGGYEVMTARGNAAQSTKGKERIIAAVIGMVLLFGSYIILNTINPDLTDLNVDPFSLDDAGTAPAPAAGTGGTTAP